MDVQVAGPAVDSQGIVPDRAGDRVFQRAVPPGAPKQENNAGLPESVEAKSFCHRRAIFQTNCVAVAGRRERPVFGGHGLFAGAGASFTPVIRTTVATAFAAHVDLFRLGQPTFVAALVLPDHVGVAAVGPFRFRPVARDGKQAIVRSIRGPCGDTVPPETGR